MADDYIMLHAKVPFGLGAPLPTDALWIDLTYDTRDPYAIHCAPRHRPQLTSWLFSRDLLNQGLTGCVGIGNVQVRPAARGTSTMIELNLPSGPVSLVTPTSEIATFLDRTFAVVPLGEESRWIDFERELSRLV